MKKVYIINNNYRQFNCLIFLFMTRNAILYCWLWWLCIYIVDCCIQMMFCCCCPRDNCCNLANWNPSLIRLAARQQWAQTLVIASTRASADWAVTQIQATLWTLDNVNSSVLIWWSVLVTGHYIELETNLCKVWCFTITEMASTSVLIVSTVIVKLQSSRRFVSK